MQELHIVLRSTLHDDSHEQIDILDCGDVIVEDTSLVIDSSKDSIVINVMGRFDLAEILGYWIEES